MQQLSHVKIENMNSGYENLSDYDQGYDDDNKFKSKNLNAERRRRKKLGDRLLELRALVPKITNMNKATIIIDAITYIEELQECVTDLSNKLHEMEATIEEENENHVNDFQSTEEIQRWVIEPEVKVNKIDGNKLWIKVLFDKKKGGFTKLLEAMSIIGYEFTDTSVITCDGAILLTACLVQNHGVRIEADKVKELLVEITRGFKIAS